MLNFHTEIRELELGQRVWIGANSKETTKYVFSRVFDKKVKGFANKEWSKNSQETTLCMVLRFSCSDHSPPFFSRFVSLCYCCWVDAIANIFFLVIFFLAALVYPFNCVDVLFFLVLFVIYISAWWVSWWWWKVVFFRVGLASKPRFLSKGQASQFR